MLCNSISSPSREAVNTAVTAPRHGQYGSFASRARTAYERRASCTHGESQYNVAGKLGGDSLLSSQGLNYAQALPGLIKDHIGDQPLTVVLLVATYLKYAELLKVWTSTLRRTIQTAQHLKYPKLTWKSLDELDAGMCDGMTYQEVAQLRFPQQAYPEDFATRDHDKFNFRYRGGESYRDVIVRLEPVIMELERQESILIIAHRR
ncbi:histidine phosphatase superfamily [Mycena olivaceomarginata]|nr:histidine phosphatase superfamily [Mycena olivaceomarginata]